MLVTREMGTVMKDTTMESPVYLDVTKPPFTLHGLYKPFMRLPMEVARNVSEGVTELATNTTGVRVTFKTTSDYIVVHSDETFTVSFNTGAVAASSFDMYFKENGEYVFRGIFHPSQGEGKDYVESALRFYNKEEKDVVIFFPIHANPTSVYIGLREGSTVDYGSEYTHKKPIVFYGSSIVHGATLLRPSLSYPAVLSRKMDTEIINLGFGGNARAEIPMMEYIASLDMSAFVYDYDYNAQSVEELRDTHYRGYEIFRKKHPDTPIIMASRPGYDTWIFFMAPDPEGDNEKRRQIVEDSYNRARAAGDKNVYFIDGRTFYPHDFRYDCTTDGGHPNELGYHYMAERFYGILKDLI